jgi:hypothetical protein
LGYALLLIPATAIYRAEELSSADWYADGRRNWKAAYLMTHSEEQADRLAKFSVYPAPLGSRLTYLEQHRLNLFRPERP